MPGDYTEGFLRRKSSDPNGPSYADLTTGDNCVLLEAQRILGRCLPPTESAGRETGLVVGYVQSGKTMSFETVISLARDNGYGVVIVLAGTKINLKEQSEKRLKKDLGIEEGNVWYHFSNPATPTVRTQIKDKLLAWHRTPEKRRAVLITVLKNKRHLENLRDVLKKLIPSEVPVLIIDDEGDQASLNTKAAKNRRKPVGAPDEKSTIYNCIADVRATVSHHSYLQYTATPQANLLLAQADLLNPNFAELVTPGSSYTGGRSFFDKPQRYVVEIPEEEVPSNTNTLSTAPKSLHSAFRYFLLAAAHHSITKVPGRDLNRSMMVHPSMQTSSHKVYKGWMDKVLASLKSYIDKNYKSDYESVAQRFHSEYDSLTKTFPSIKPLQELINAMAEEVLNGELNLVAVNSTPEAEKNIDWKQTAYWILVGGNKLDRGYTVEGLCSTYMPRFLGKTPTADTLQQRARFFGYKDHYLGLCRVFVQGNVRDAFTEYVEHEEFVRKALEATQGQPLREWRREFLLDEMLRPTRPNVIGLGIKQMSIAGWIVPSALQRDEDAAASNRALIAKVRKDWESKYHPAINAAKILDSKLIKGESRHFAIQGIMLRDVLEDFLLKIQVKDPQDAEEHSALLISITEAIREDSTRKADVFLMNNLSSDYRTRVEGHGLPAEHKYAPINQYFSQSAGSINDKHYCSKERVTLQLRKFDLGTVKRDEAKADIRNVTWFALHMPSTLEKGIVVESEN
jgi:hypothetical protein